MRYIVYTWRGGYFTVPHLVEANDWDEALWKGVDEAIKDNTIYYKSDDEAYEDFKIWLHEEKLDEAFLLDDDYDFWLEKDHYMIEHCGYSIYDNEDDFIGYVSLENIRVISEDDDGFERALSDYES